MSADKNDGVPAAWGWAAIGAVVLKLFTKVMQWWRWRDSAAAKLRDELTKELERFGRRIAALERENTSLRLQNSGQQEQINQLKVDLATEKGLKIEALDRVTALQVSNATLEAQMKAIQERVSSIDNQGPGGSVRT